MGNSGITMAGAFALAIGIAIQNFPEGAIISMPLQTEGAGKTKAFLYGVLSGIVEPLGAVLTLAATSLIIPALPYLLSFAAGAMLYFREQGIRIPEELSLIGCDNVPFDDVLEIPLSTVEVPTGEMGSFIGKELVTLLQEEEWAGGTRRTVYYDPDLYLRGSVRKVGEGMPWKNE